MDMKQQRFGIEIELTGIARKRGAEIAAAYFGTQSYYEGTYYDTYVALDSQGREWKFMKATSSSTAALWTASAASQPQVKGPWLWTRTAGIWAGFLPAKVSTITFPVSSS